MSLSVITQFQYFILFIIMLNIGLCGIILNYNNMILTMISIKLCLLYVNLNFIFYSLLITQLLDIEKLSSYECGFDPFNIRFYLVSLLFIIFDLGITFLFPWAISFEHFGYFRYLTMIFFLSLLGIRTFFSSIKEVLYSFIMVLSVLKNNIKKSNFFILLFILFLFYLDLSYATCDSISAANPDLILDIENDQEYVNKRTKVAFAILVVSLICFGLMFLYLNSDNSGSADTVLKLPTVNPNSSLSASSNWTLKGESYGDYSIMENSIDGSTNVILWKFNKMIRVGIDSTFNSNSTTYSSTAIKPMEGGGIRILYDNPDNGVEESKVSDEEKYRVNYILANHKNPSPIVVDPVSDKVYEIDDT